MVIILLFVVFEPDVERWFQIALSFFLGVWLVTKTIIEERDDSYEMD